MSPEFLQKWERLIEGVEKEKIPVEFVRKLVLKLVGKKQRTINIEQMLSQGVDPEQVEEIISRRLIELEDNVLGIEFVLNVQSIADHVQPETDRLLNRL
jgi:hypothetical protein